MRRNPSSRPVGKSRQKVRRAVLEALEARQLLAVDMVTSLTDAGPNSLRVVVANASPGDTIEFSNSLSGQTIILSSGPINIQKNLTIIGLGENNLTISGNLENSVFTVGAGVTVGISNLEIEQGYTLLGEGGGINNQGTLSLVACDFNENVAEYGGGIYNAGGTVSISYCSLTGGEAEQGGAIVNAAGGTMTITGTTIGSNESYESAGGGIANENSTLTITNSTVSENLSNTYGGGIANESDGILVINGSVIQGNTGFGWGGGIFNFAGATLTVENGSLIEGNVSYSDFGGGLFNDQATATIDDSTVTGNYNEYAGGGAANFLGTLTITGSTFSTNGSGNPDQDLGGGVWDFGGTTTITSSTFDANQAESGAGVYGDQNSDIIIASCTFENNDASENGGGVFITNTGYISNSTITGNQAQVGAGIATSGTLTVVNTTISANVSISSSGGGLFISNGNTTLWNTIVAGNTYAGTTASDIAGRVDEGLAVNESPSSNNLIGTGGSGGLDNGVNGNIVGLTNPGLGPLQNNGGSILTMALLPGSPAIDAGNNSLAVDSNGNPLAYDERGLGYPRIVGAAVDIGAFEVQSTPGVQSNASPAIGASPFVAASPLSAPPRPSDSVALPNFIIESDTPDVADAPPPYTPAQLRSAYGVNNISFNGTMGTGAGETIAIVDAYNDPDIISDANAFSANFDLPQFNGPGEPTLTILGQTGSTLLPNDGDPGNWDVEESLDVEYAHVEAPMANIVVFEANSDESSDLYTAVATAADYSNVCVVSMSWGEPEIYDYLGGVSQTSTDSLFTTPAGHQGVTFIASTGDDAAPAMEYPALSPNVLSAGGTSLLVGTDGSYQGENAWSDGGGGVSLEEPQPAFQNGNVNGLSGTNRVGPDVAFDSDPESGVEILDTYYTPSYLEIGGTSVAAPDWAGLIAVADQGRVLNGLSTLDGATQTLPALYALPSSDFNDVASGDNGYPATAGYDAATGLGSPVANLLVPALAGASSGPTLSFASAPVVPYAGAPISSPLVVDIKDHSGNIITGDNSLVTLVLANGPGNIDGTLTVQAQNGIATFNGNWFSTAGTYLVQAIDGNDTVATSGNIVVGNPPGLAGSGYYFTGTQGALNLVAYSGTITLSDDLSPIFPNYELSIESHAKVVLESTQTVTALQFLDDTGTLDVTTFSMIIDYGSNPDPKATLLRELKAGTDAGPLTTVADILSSGPGFGLTYGIGYADGADGIDGSLTSGQFEVGYALYGDITMQGVVNGQDFSIMANHFGHVTTDGWEAGDFVYFGDVDSFDFALLTDNFGATAVADQPAQQPSAGLPQTDSSSPVTSEATSAALPIANAATIQTSTKKPAPSPKVNLPDRQVAAVTVGAIVQNMQPNPWQCDVTYSPVERFLRTSQDPIP